MVSVACLAVGSRIAYDGGVWMVVALAGDRVTVQEQHSGQMLSVRIASLLSAPGSRLMDSPVAGLVGAVGPPLANLTDVELAAVCERAGHVREVLTGYRSGSPDDALAGEPRAGYEPGMRVMDRYRAKADELGVGVRTLRRWVRSFLLDGEAGLIDGRQERASEPLRGIDPRWLDVLRGVLDEHVGASRPTQALLLDRVDARAVEQHGQDVIPKRWKAKLAVGEVVRGTNALAGSTKGKRSIANRPGTPYGRLVATRPGEYLLLDTTTLDVFAMDAVTAAVGRVGVHGRGGSLQPVGRRVAALTGLDEGGGRVAGAVRGDLPGLEGANGRRAAAVPGGPQCSAGRVWRAAGVWFAGGRARDAGAR